MTEEVGPYVKEPEPAEYRPLHSMRLGKYVLTLDWVHTETRDLYLGLINGLVVVGAPGREEVMFYLIDMAMGLVGGGEDGNAPSLGFH